MTVTADFRKADHRRQDMAGVLLDWRSLTSASLHLASGDILVVAVAAVGTAEEEHRLAADTLGIADSAAHTVPRIEEMVVVVLLEANEEVGACTDSVDVADTGPGSWAPSASAHHLDHRTVERAVEVAVAADNGSDHHFPEHHNVVAAAEGA